MDVSLVSPGHMGVAVAVALAGNGHQVMCALDGRSRVTRERAAALGLLDAGTVRAAGAKSEIMFSVCPPEASLEVAGQAVDFRGVFVDLNTISPERAREVAGVIRRRGGTYVDGAIVGRPPSAQGDARLYLSGEAAPEVATLFQGSLFEARGLDRGDYCASALKMMEVGWTAGSAALLLAIDAAARRFEVHGALEEEWKVSHPDLPERTAKAARGAAAAAGRCSSEMEHVARALGAAGVPSSFHLAAAEVYARAAVNLEPEDPELLERLGVALTGAAGPVQTGPSRRSARGVGDAARSLFRRPSDSMTLPELLVSWGVALDPDEAVRWFGPCATETRSGYVVVTGRRLLFVNPVADEVEREERPLETIVAVQERAGRRPRLTIRGENWELELRGLGGGRSLSELRTALEPGGRGL